MRKFIILSVALVAALSGCQSQVIEKDTKNEVVRGIIVPHHNLVGDYIDDLYENIANDEIKHIVLISPNHFDTGRGDVQTDTNLSKQVNFNYDLMKSLVERNIVNLEPGTMNNEHGIRVHTDRIPSYFPNADVLPIIIKWKTGEKQLDQMIDSLSKNVDMENTLFIGSIDFSHYVTEDTALANDEKIKEWLAGWYGGMNFQLNDIWSLEKSKSKDVEISTAMDSPETFYSVLKILDEDGLKADVIRRTSSLSLTGKEDGDPMQNTSHLFIEIK